MFSDTDNGSSAFRADETASLLEQEIPIQPAVLHRAFRSFARPVAELIDVLTAREVDDWVVTGCGDSLFAGMCAEVWFARLAGRRLRAVQAMQLSRETYMSLTPRSVVVAVSHSGTTARVLEAARAARSRGAFVVAVTANPDSELARCADLWIDNSVRDERSNCRTASFQAVSLLMRMLAEQLGTPDGSRARSFDPTLLEPYVYESRRQIADIAASASSGTTGSSPGVALGSLRPSTVWRRHTKPRRCPRTASRWSSSSTVRYSPCAKARTS